MNSREIILANFNHEGPRPGLTFTQEGRINDFIGTGLANPRGYTPRRWVEGEFEYYDDMWGNIWHRAVNGCSGGEIYRPVLEDWKDLEKLVIPEYDFDAEVTRIKATYATAPDKFKTIWMPGWIFAASRYLRKMEIYLMDMLLYPDELQILHEKLAGFYEKIIIAVAASGAEAIVFAEDMGTQNGLLFSPKLWDECFREIYTRLFGIAHEKGMKVMMHSCGQNREILEPLLKAGVDCFQFDQPAIYDQAELAGLLKRYKAVLWSPIDIQKILPTGNYEIIKKGVDDMFKHFDGFLIFKNYPDLPGIGVKEEWDQFAYDEILKQIRN